eukprot:COSAG05_NODE_25177_length_198_cov_33.767677_2_plen_20_part_01
MLLQLAGRLFRQPNLAPTAF